MVCPNCAAEISPKMRFCAECGMKLEAGQSTVSFAPSFGEEAEGYTPTGGGTGIASLIELDQVEGTAGRRMHDIDDEVVTVGRGSESSIFLDDVTVSRKHAEVLRGRANLIRAELAGRGVSGLSSEELARVLLGEEGGAL